MQITRFDIEKWYLKYEFTSKYNLSSSGISPSFFTKKNKELLKLIYDFPYSQAKGRKELIKILASIYNVKEENIIVTNGAIESLFILQILFSTKKEKIICLKPCYNGLFNIFKSFGTKIIDWEIRYEDNFRPNFEYLEYLIKKHKPKYLVINFPNNPTGINLTEKEYFVLKDLSIKYNFIVISDEVYKELSNNFFYDWYKNKIVVSSLSKSYGLPGIRIGWIVAKKEIINNVLNLRHYTTLCNNVFSEQLAINVLKNKEYYLKISNDIRKENYKILLNFDFLEHVKIDAGFTIFVKTNFDTEKFCIDLEKQKSILLLPGNKYDKKYKNFFRLGFGIEKEKLIYCLIKLKDFFYKYKNENSIK